MASWNYHDPRVLELRMEEIVGNPLAGWRRILDHLEVAGVSQAELAQVLEKLSFDNLSGGRRKGDEDRMHHYRRGIPGDWRNYLGRGHLRAIQARYGDLVERLGYEKE